MNTTARSASSGRIIGFTKPPNITAGIALKPTVPAPNCTKPESFAGAITTVGGMKTDIAGALSVTGTSTTMIAATIATMIATTTTSS